MNITFGLSDYGKMNYMMQMADLFHEKKKYEKEMMIDNAVIDKNKKKIQDINLKGQKIMQEMERYVKMNRSRAVVAFA